jgi:hypothetical protein
MPPNPHTIKPNTMHLLDITVKNDIHELDMAKFQIVNLQAGKVDEDAVNFSQLTSVERKFDEEVIGVKASITSHGTRLTTHDSQISTLESIVNNPNTGNHMLDNRMDSIESAFGLGPDGINGAEVLQKIKDAYILINNVADSDIASTLTTLFNKDVELAKKIVDEYERATNSERTISERLSVETEERIKEDGLIRLDFAKADKDLETALSVVIKTESDRAKEVEDGLRTSIDANRTYSDEQDARLAQDIDSEFKRATRVEGELGTQIFESNLELNTKIDESKLELNTKIDEVKGELESKIDEVETTLEAKIDEVDVKLELKIDGVETTLGTKIDGVETTLGTKIDGVETTLGTKIDDVEAKLDLEDAKIRQDVLNLGAEFNGLLNSSNEKLGLQIKNVADTLASLLTKLFGKNDEFTGVFIIDKGVNIE